MFAYIHRYIDTMVEFHAALLFFNLRVSNLNVLLFCFVGFVYALKIPIILELTSFNYNMEKSC